MAKTLYHGELAGRGPTVLTIKSEPKPSTKKKGTFYIEVVMDGVDRYLNPENETCLEFFRGTAGRTMTVCAKESREAAFIEYVGEAEPAAAATAAAPARSATPPPASAHRPPPPPPGAAKPPPAGPPPTASARPASPPPPPAGTVVGHPGQRVGACMNNAVDVVSAIGIDPMSPQFYSTVHFIASNLIRVSAMLERGDLAAKPEKGDA